MLACYGERMIISLTQGFTAQIDDPSYITSHIVPINCELHVLYCDWRVTAGHTAFPRRPSTRPEAGKLCWNRRCMISGHSNQRLALSCPCFVLESVLACTHEAYITNRANRTRAGNHRVRAGYSTAITPFHHVEPICCVGLATTPDARSLTFAMGISWMFSAEARRGLG